MRRVAAIVPTDLSFCRDRPDVQINVHDIGAATGTSYLTNEIVPFQIWGAASTFGRVESKNAIDFKSIAASRNFRVFQLWIIFFNKTRRPDLSYRLQGLWPLASVHMIRISSDWESWLPISPNFVFMPLTLGLQTTVGRRPSWHSFTSLGLYCSKDSELSICSVFNVSHNASQQDLQFLAAGFRTIPTH